MRMECSHCHQVREVEAVGSWRGLVRCLSCLSLQWTLAGTISGSPHDERVGTCLDVWTPPPVGILVHLEDGSAAANAYRRPSVHGAVRIQREWFTRDALGVLTCSLFLVCGILCMASLASMSPAVPDIWKVMLWCMLVAPAAGVYWAMTNLVNLTELDVADGVVTVRHRPLPWLHGRELPVSSIDHLTCKGTFPFPTDDTPAVYEIRAYFKDGRHVPLLTSMTLEHAAYLFAGLHPLLGLSVRS